MEWSFHSVDLKILTLTCSRFILLSSLWKFPVQSKYPWKFVCCIEHCPEGLCPRSVILCRDRSWGGLELHGGDREGQFWQRRPDREGPTWLSLWVLFGGSLQNMCVEPQTEAASPWVGWGSPVSGSLRGECLGLSQGGMWWASRAFPLHHESRGLTLFSDSETVPVALPGAVRCLVCGCGFLPCWAVSASGRQWASPSPVRCGRRGPAQHGSHGSAAFHIWYLNLSRAAQQNVLRWQKYSVLCCWPGRPLLTGGY